MVDHIGLNYVNIYLICDATVYDAGLYMYSNVLTPRVM